VKSGWVGEEKQKKKSAGEVLSAKVYNMHKGWHVTLLISHEFHEIEKNMETNKKTLEKSCQI